LFFHITNRRMWPKTNALIDRLPNCMWAIRTACKWTWSSPH